MLPYVLIWGLTSWLALTHMRPHSGLSSSRSFRMGPAWLGMYVILVLFIGLRHEVGPDWGPYFQAVDSLKSEPLHVVFSGKDVAYEFLNWIGANFGGEIYFVNLVCSALFCYGLFNFCQIQPRPWLALFVAVPYFVLVVSMSATRQSVAAGLAMLAIANLELQNFYRFFIWISIAVLFHKTALILIPFGIFAAKRNRLLIFGFSALLISALFTLTTYEKIAYFNSVYIEDQSDSPGAQIRIFINAISAAFLIAFPRRFSISYKMHFFWHIMAWVSLFFVLLLLISPSSTAVDRLAIYLYPVQLVVFSRIPDAFGVIGRRNPIWVNMIVVFYSTIFFVWFLFANHSPSFIPYRFILWEEIWK